MTEELKCHNIGEITGGAYANIHEQCRRIWGTDGASPTCTVHTGGGHDIKMAEETPHFRIRKLTERECYRLMGMADEDSAKLIATQNKTSLYHLAGDSIVTTVLMAIFGEMFGMDWESKVKEHVERLCNNESIHKI